MRLIDLDPEQIAEIHVDRTIDGHRVPFLWQGDAAEFVRELGHRRVRRVGRLVVGKRFRVLLKPQSPRYVTVAAGMSVSSAGLGFSIKGVRACD